jgi:hypothetical protein
MDKKRLKKLIVLAPIGITAILLFVLIGGQVVRLLWNWLMPPLFGWHEVTFWQALGLLALTRILFGGCGGRGGVRRRLDERWDMTDEERERFRQGMRRRFGIDPPASDTKHS